MPGRGTSTERSTSTWPHAEPTPYRLMLRGHNYEPWRPWVGLLICLVLYGPVWPGLRAVAFLVTAAVTALFQPHGFSTDFAHNIDLDRVRPATLLATNVAIASLIPLTWWVVRYLHHVRPRWLASVRPRIRWGFLFTCLGLALLALVLQVVIGNVLSGSTDSGDNTAHRLTGTVVVSLVIVALTTPFQAVGEEYLFRGYLLQAIGAMVRAEWFRWVVVVVTALLFAAAHATQNLPLFLDRLAFGLVAGWLVIRTGGLEAGIALHVLNNYLSFGVAILFGSLSDTATVTDASWSALLASVVELAAYAAAVTWVARDLGLSNRTPPAGR